jgi:hypothetical protein
MQVAAVGLDLHKHSGKGLASMQSYLSRRGRYVNI